MNAQNNYTLHKKAKGARPYFFADNTQDKMLAMIMGLTGELSVLMDRVDTLERLLVTKKVLEEGAVASFIASPEVREARDEQREVVLANVMRILLEDLEDPDSGEPNDESYLKIVDEVLQS